MQTTIFVNPLTGEPIHQQAGTTVETEVLDTVVSGPVYTEVEGDAEVLGGTVTIIVESVRPNAAHREYMDRARAELDSPEGKSALEQAVAELPEGDRESAIERARAVAMEAALHENPHKPASIVRQTMSNIPQDTVDEIAKSIRAGTVKGRNKVADLISASTPVPKGAW
jgi:transglutaminase-like putative cysteine protease